jgi:3-hydroxy-9,10-secoandrosta-1,3,5(10)-triene-9,17-dione monooxygenase reductase component
MNKPKDKPKNGRPPLYACHMVATATRQIGKLYAADLRRLNVSFPQFQVLAALAGKDGQKPGALAAWLSANGSSMTDLLDQLEEQELIERRADVEDRRAIRVYLTAKGRARQRDGRAIVDRFNYDLAAKLTRQEMQSFRKVILAIRELTGGEDR